MAARLLSQTLLRHVTLPIFTPTLTPPISAIILRHHSSSSQFKRGEIIEIDIESSDSESSVEMNGVKKLEEIVQRIIVRRSQPAWLPFMPGTSYWVPPMKKPGNFAEVLGRLANPLSEEEAMSLTTVRGWPSSDFFINDAGKGAAPVVVNLEGTSTGSTEVEVLVETEVPDSLQKDSTNITKSD